MTSVERMSRFQKERFEEFARVQKEQLDAFAKALEKLIDSNEKKSSELRAVVDYNKSLSNLARQLATTLDKYNLAI